VNNPIRMSPAGVSRRARGLKRAGAGKRGGLSRTSGLLRARTGADRTGGGAIQQAASEWRLPLRSPSPVRHAGYFPSAAVPSTCARSPDWYVALAAATMVVRAIDDSWKTGSGLIDEGFESFVLRRPSGRESCWDRRMERQHEQPWSASRRPAGSGGRWVRCWLATAHRPTRRWCWHSSASITWRQPVRRASST
jgi:hypothetical protein